MKRIIGLVFTILVVFSAISLGVMLTTEDFDSLPSLDSGETYRMLYTENIPRDNLSSFLVGEGFLALHYDSLGLVNVYDLNGKFLYGIQVETSQNGRGDISCEESTLYIKSRNSRIYVVQDGAVVKNFRYDYKSEESRHIAELMTAFKPVAYGSTVYYYIESANQITKTEDGKDMVPVISMPAKNPGIAPMAFLLLLSVCGLVHCLVPEDNRISALRYRLHRE